ncbi:signal peptidase, endoplasmic reticulum-type [Haladaptatus litoreus]|uniref:Signal peptidase, endoplasmic reticulum-type n=1 Tax=Haladaptatus litoreus TaxID=553468 RepID=A0A1N7B5K5_9EURY|nr:S26 family signal peptidase [Haladaptatus litoreus]SIR46588.1 signal peptidase, endoplasmic reticulum-type [Haladaptatus litoreus]
MWAVGIGLLLFAISGVWPPMVAVESGSMEPQMERGDLIFVMEEGRLAGDGSHGDTGVVTYRAGQNSGYSEFNQPGDVIIFEPNGDGQAVPIIHRAMFWVDEGENWYDEANPDYVGTATNCEQLTNCPAPHAGFITKGDNNGGYDQASFGAHTAPVKPSWVVGKAKLKIPWLGHVRLQFGIATPPELLEAETHPVTNSAPNSTDSTINSIAVSA